VTAPAQLLLVGNSRWHWAALEAGTLHCWHTPPADDPAAVCRQLTAWAAVGPLPVAGSLPAERRLRLDQVPLQGLPPWLGIDRALAGWGAWRLQQLRRAPAGVLVADAGTALSLSRVDASGQFCGGRLSAGLGLQLRALGQHTAQLPCLAVEVGEQRSEALQAWPLETAAALQRGCLEGCCGAIRQAWDEVSAGLEPATQAPWGLWLTGGDAPRLAPELRAAGLPVALEPNLCLQALAELTGLLALS